MNLPGSCSLCFTPAVQIRWLHTGYAVDVGPKYLLRAGHC